MVLSQPVSLLLVSMAAAFLPWISRYLRVPAVVMEILFGVVLGKSLLQLQLGGEWMPILAELGFLLLMFHSGMEINFNMLIGQSRRNLLVQLGIFAATLAMAVGVAVLIGRGVFLALVLSTTSLGLVMPTLKEAGLSRTATGQSVLVAATLADFLTLFGITMFLLWNDSGLSLQLLTPFPLFLGFGVLLWAGRLWAWWHPRQAGRFLGPSDSQEIGVRYSLALLFLFVALSELVHMEPVLGAFMGGCVIAFVFRGKIDLEGKISALGFGFLIPIFFIHVGMQFDVASLFSPGQLLFTLVLLAAALAVKIVPALLFVLLRLPLRAALRNGILLSSRLSLIVAAASIGLEQGFLDQPTKDAVVFLALLTCFLGPTLFKLLKEKRS